MKTTPWDYIVFLWHGFCLAAVLIFYAAFIGICLWVIGGMLLHAARAIF